MTIPLERARLALRKIEAAREALATGQSIDRTDDLLADAVAILAAAIADAEDTETIDLDNPPV